MPSLPGPLADPPYLRIVADIRHRIAAGQLRDGDRVPSARQLTQQWGVALATASRALATLRQDGLVRAVPGVGTVVDAPIARRTVRKRDVREPDLQVTPQRIVRTAIEMADAEGLALLSMRRIAAQFGIPTMSLYRHVRSKDDLVLMMADAVLGEDPLPAAPGPGWRAPLELIARLQWAGYKRHPWLAPVISMNRPQLLPNGMAHTEWTLRALDGLGLDASTMLHATVALVGYVRGTAMNFEAQAQAEQDTGLTDDEWITSQAATFAAAFASERYRKLAELTARPDVVFDLDSLFEFGLQRLLDGYAALIGVVHIA